MAQKGLKNSQRTAHATTVPDPEQAPGTQRLNNAEW
jgi:hypothetical protein